MNERDGGPAFPRSVLDHGHGVTSHYEAGMTLRDYFAVHASDGDIACQLSLVSEPVSSSCARYMHADAMMKERAK